MKMIKHLTIVSLVVAMAMSLAIPASAVTYSHGNDYSACRCYAKTSQTGVDYSIGAKITWQLSGQSTVIDGELVTSDGAVAESRSNWLWGKTGKSFGYYYLDGQRTHESTKWMDFSF